jgi:GntR family transcriptional regulator
MGKSACTVVYRATQDVLVSIDHDGDVPVYIQLANLLRAAIESGDLAPRRPVPSKRTLMQEHGVAGGTIDKAIAILRDEGLVRTVTGRGIYVVERG